MTINIYALYTNHITQFFACKSRKCTVILSTGKKVTFDKRYKLSKVGYMTEVETQEYKDARRILGF